MSWTLHGPQPLSSCHPAAIFVRADALNFLMSPVWCCVTFVAWLRLISNVQTTCTGETGGLTVWDNTAVHDLKPYTCSVLQVGVGSWNMYLYWLVDCHCIQPQDFKHKSTQVPAFPRWRRAIVRGEPETSKSLPMSITIADFLKDQSLRTTYVNCTKLHMFLAGQSDGICCGC